MKSNPGTAENISIEQIEPLLKSILKSQGLTEKQLCIELGYNRGYISQLRSREKTLGEPQISPKFHEKLKSYSLQNAKNTTPEFEPNIADDPVGNKNEGAFSKGMDAFNALLAEKDRAIKKAEERALKAEERALKAEEFALKLIDIISNSSKEMYGNLSDVAADLTQNNQQLAQLKDPPLPIVKKGKTSAGLQKDRKKSKGH